MKNNSIFTIETEDMIYEFHIQMTADMVGTAVDDVAYAPAKKEAHYDELVEWDDNELAHDECANEYLVYYEPVSDRWYLLDHEDLGGFTDHEDVVALVNTLAEIAKYGYIELDESLDRELAVTHLIKRFCVTFVRGVYLVTKKVTQDFIVTIKNIFNGECHRSTVKAEDVTSAHLKAMDELAEAIPNAFIRSMYRLEVI